jgi:predicted Kef-type K+ transport protein
MDPVVVTLTFGLGYLMQRIGLPPLVGFLLAGLGLHSIGYTDTPLLSAVSDIGVTLLLFTIGLKLKIKSLLKPEVWAGATLHMGLTVPFFGFVLFALAHTGLTFFLGLNFATALLLAFGLSFSSTVFAVKILEESRRMNSLNGRIAIGVLIIQDIVAVVYLTLSTGKVPSVWALVVIGLLPVARWIFLRMMDRVGHGELQVLFGIFLALTAGAAVFDMVGLKADLGALVLGMLIAPHPRAKEMANSLMSIKDILLVGFFLKIGLSGLPDASGLVAAGMLVLILPLKMILYFIIFTRFKLKARTSFVTTLNLANYSEFGLIVCALAAAGGKIDPQWLVVLAIALSVSLIVASPLNRYAESVFDSMRNFLVKFEVKKRHPEERPYTSGTWRIGIVGMGRIGVGAYDLFKDRFGDVVIGLDFDPDTVALQSSKGRAVTQGDITEPDFWRRLPEQDGSFNLLVLAIPDLDSKLYAAKMLKKRGYQGDIAAVVQFDDEVQTLLDAGVSAVFNIYNEAGAGLAAHICDTLKTFKK